METFTSLSPQPATAASALLIALLENDLLKYLALIPRTRSLAEFTWPRILLPYCRKKLPHHQKAAFFTMTLSHEETLSRFPRSVNPPMTGVAPSLFTAIPSAGANRYGHGPRSFVVRRKVKQAVKRRQSCFALPRSALDNSQVQPRSQLNRVVAED